MSNNEQNSTSQQKYKISRQKILFSNVCMFLITVCFIFLLHNQIKYKSFSKFILIAQTDLLTTTFHFIIIQCFILLIMEMLSQLINYFGPSNINNLFEAIQKASLMLIQYLAIFILSLYLHWKTVKDDQEHLSCLMEIFFYGSCSYIASVLIAQETRYVSLKFLGIGLMIMPIGVVLGDFFGFNLLAH